MSQDTVGEFLRDRARRFGAADYVVCDDDRLTYGAAEARSRRLARGLLAAGVGRGTRVAILFPTGLSFVVSWLAITRIGAIAVPISTFSTPDELRGLLASSDAGVLLAVGAYRGHDYIGELDRALGGVDFSSPVRPASSHAPSLRRVHFEVPPGKVHDAHTIESLCDGGASLPDACFDAVEADVRPDDRMIIVYTSGSTSAPKGVIHQHGPLLQHMVNLNDLRGLTAGVRLFSNSPLFWIGGIGYNVIGTLVAGATLLCSTAASPAETLDFIERERPELVNGYAQSISHLTADPGFAARDFSSIRSGNLYPLLPDPLRPIDLELRHNMLGMTETGSVCLMSSDERDQPERYRGSFGRPVPGVQALVVDPDTLEEVPPGVLGELWLRGAFLMEGYYGRERADVFTPDQWFRTGDIFATDDDGFYYFKGRRGDMIKTSGANVSPREVEAVLREATGGLTAIVLALPDPVRDQIVAAVIVAPDDVELDLALVQQSLRSRLSAYKVPRKLVRVTPDALPMLSSGKPDLRRLVEVFDGT
jgi:acyl-CoA synthetase (AMP-forming)/AMP-acid ligase II